MSFRRFFPSYINMKNLTLKKFTMVKSNQRSSTYGTRPKQDMLIPSPQKWFHFNRRCAQCWIEWKINFHIFQFWQIIFTIYERHAWICKCVTDQKSFFKRGQIYRKDAQWAETNAKSIFRFLTFLFLEFWLILLLIIHGKMYLVEYKTDHIGKFIFHSFQHIPHLSCK